jgi:SAM-dependent methyltransferase
MTFRDPNTLYKVDKEVGSISSIVRSVDLLKVYGFVDPAIVERYDFKTIVLMDGADRFITGAELSPDGNWSASINAGHLGKDNSCLKLQAFAASESSGFVFPLWVDGEATETYYSFAKDFLPDDSKDVPTFRSEFRELIINATKVPYVARSVYQSIKTGNNYQSLDLGQTQRIGGRLSRENFLFQIDFSGKTVLDIGANTGENSRIARRLGASLVDGYEYDPFFVEVGRAINAVTGMTRVSLFQGDCTKPELFAGMKYDLVLALSVWIYLKDTMKQVADITDTMILETHTLDHGIGFYYSSILPYFPYAISLGLTDKPKDPHKSRMLVVFGKDREKLEQLVRREFLLVKPYFNNTFIKLYDRLGKTEILKLADNFLEKHRNQTAYTNNDYKYGVQTYYEIFLAGLAQYLKSDKRVDSQNIYVDFLKRGIQEGLIDQGLANFTQNDSWMIKKVANKYEDALNILDGKVDFVPPVEIVPDPKGKLTFTTTTGEDIRCNIFDGHHRFFMCELAGVEKMHFVRNDGEADIITQRFSQTIAPNYTLQIQ